MILALPLCWDWSRLEREGEGVNGRSGKFKDTFSLLQASRRHGALLAPNLRFFSLARSASFAALNTLAPQLPSLSPFAIFPTSWHKVSNYFALNLQLSKFLYVWEWNFDNISEINEILMEFFFRAFEKQSIFVVLGASINREWRTNPLQVIDFVLWNKILLETSRTISSTMKPGDVTNEGCLSRGKLYQGAFLNRRKAKCLTILRIITSVFAPILRPPFLNNWSTWVSAGVAIWCENCHQSHRNHNHWSCPCLGCSERNRDF